MTAKRTYTLFDQLLMQLDHGLRALQTPPSRTTRANPAAATPSGRQLDNAQARRVAGLMRVNHSGEVCAQALYQGQALTAQLADVREQMNQAVAEEQDHLLWCQQRLEELDSHTSRLNPFFYFASFGVGALAGIAGDKWSLGFVAETERQVCRHLEKHLKRLPAEDQRSRAILQQMHEDEARHADNATSAGGGELPVPIRLGMTLASKAMTKTCYYL